MPTSKSSCPICGNKDFDEQDGRFYCTECFTQSQDFHVQETEDFGFSNTPLNLTKHIGGSNTKTKSLPETRAETLFGRPWTIYEGYQYVILAQVDALISLGASPHLKDIVYSVWANYLRRLGVAFCAYEHLVPDIVLQTGIARLREINRGSFENPKNRAKPFSSHSKEDEEDDLDSDINNEFHIEADDLLAACHRQGKRTIRGTYDRRLAAAHKSPEWMNMPKTITFCYIGLMITNPDILPHDIIRWIYSGDVPFLSVTHVLPADLVLSGSDYCIFRVNKFTSQNLRSELGKMQLFLRLTDIVPVPVERLIARFVHDLALPGEVKSAAIQLSQLFPSHQYSFTRNPLLYKTDITALGYIITALSLGLGLTTTAHRDLSACTRKLQSLIGPSPALFVWSDWEKATRERHLHQFDSCQEYTQPIHKSELRHVGSFIKSYEQIGRGKRKSAVVVTRHNQVFERFRAEYQEGLISPLTVALDRLNLQALQQEEQNREKVETDRLAHFRETTLCHITDPDTFCERHRSQVLKAGLGAEVLIEFLRTRPKTFQPLSKTVGVDAHTTSANRSRKKSKRKRRSQQAATKTSPQCATIAWLVGLCSNVIGCAQARLSKTVADLHQCVLMKNDTDDIDAEPLTISFVKPPALAGKKFLRKARLKKEAERKMLAKEFELRMFRENIDGGCMKREAERKVLMEEFE